MDDSIRILVVDDEKLLVKGIKFNLENEGYQVETAFDGAAAVELARSESFDLIILDLMMPEVDGLTACMRIREFSAVPIIMLTARSEDADKIIGLESGADDYVTKPFNILELKARIRALLRRAGQTAQKRTELLTAGGIALDTERRIALRDGVPVDLTAKEYDILELLIKNPHRVYSRENLMDLVWGYTYAGDYRTVDVHIRRLRDGQCTVYAGLVFLDILINAERIADQCSNLGVYTISQFDPSVMNSHHEYIHRLHQGNDPVFNREYQEKHEKYFGMLSAIND